MVHENVPGKLPYHSPILQPVNPKDIIEANKEVKESSDEEILNLKNAEEFTSKDHRVDSSLYYLLLVMPLLRAQLQRDYSWISWTFKRVIDIRVLAQHYPPQYNFERRKITAGVEDGPRSGSYNKVTFVDLTISERAAHPRYEAFIGHNATNVEQTSTEGTSKAFFSDLSFLSSSNPPQLIIVESQLLVNVNQGKSP